MTLISDCFGRVLRCYNAENKGLGPERQLLASSYRLLAQAIATPKQDQHQWLKGSFWLLATGFQLKQRQHQNKTSNPEDTEGPQRGKNSRFLPTAGRNDKLLSPPFAKNTKDGAPVWCGPVKAGGLG